MNTNSKQSIRTVTTAEFYFSECRQMLRRTMNTPVTYHPYLQGKESITVVVSSENIIFNP